MAVRYSVGNNTIALSMKKGKFREFRELRVSLEFVVSGCIDVLSFKEDCSYFVAIPLPSPRGCQSHTACCLEMTMVQH